MGSNSLLGIPMKASELFVPIRNERGTDTVFIQPNSTPLSADALEAANKLFRVAEELLPAGGQPPVWQLVHCRHRSGADA
jgi:Glutathione S-transferase, C-terminal domain